MDEALDADAELPKVLTSKRKTVIKVSLLNPRRIKYQTNP